MVSEDSDAGVSASTDSMEAWRAKRIRKFGAQLKALGHDVKTDPDKAPTRELMLELLAGSVCANREDQAVQLWSELFPQAKWGAPFAAGPTADLDEWCERHGVSTRIIEPSIEVALPASNADALVRYRSQPVVFATLSDASWVPGSDFVVASDGTVISDSGAFALSHATSAWPHAHVLDPETVVYHRPAQEQYVDDDVIYLSAPAGGHIGHWMVDYLPRLLAWDCCGCVPKVAVPSSIYSKHLETLRAFGLQDSDILICEGGYTYKFARLHIYKPGRYFQPHPKHIAFVREILSRHAQAPTKGKRLFLARGNINTRNVANADEFQALLDSAGFMSVDMAALSIAEQQTLLADAEFLLGAFGSNMLALYMAPPSCRVMCLTDRTYEGDGNFCLLAAAFAFGQPYCEVLCPIASDAGQRLQKKDADIVVDCEYLRQHPFFKS